MAGVLHLPRAVRRVNRKAERRRDLAPAPRTSIMRSRMRGVRWWMTGVLVVSLGAAGCSLFRASPSPPSPDGVQVGIASWYGPGFHGNRTANGEIYDQYELTAAHRTLPLGTRAMVTNITNGRSVEVRINDRGPFVKGRIIDLSTAAAEALGIIGRGVAMVEVEVVS